MTSDQQYNFRQQVNARLKDPRKDSHLGLSLDDNLRFGTANRPSTPIKAVVEGFFGDVAAHETQQKYKELVARPQTGVARKMSEMRQTKGSVLAQQHIRQSSNKVQKLISQPEDLFKMSKFKNVNARTNTHNGGRSSALTSHRKNQAP